MIDDNGRNMIELDFPVWHTGAHRARCIWHANKATYELTKAWIGDSRLITKFSALIGNRAAMCERYFADDVEINAKWN